jgi:hypothetical protein
MRRLVWVLIAAICLPVPQALAWGNEGHTVINQVAAGKVPAAMPAFIREAAQRIAYVGQEPDRWRHPSELALRNAQEPDHFIDLERLEGMPELPPGRYDFYKLLYAKRAAAGANGDIFLPEKVGLQPYITIEIYDRLKVAFREYRRLKAEHKPTGAVGQNIVFYAGWMGHYVADGSQPLHTTIHYNGWVGPNPKGYTTEKIHWQFEGPFVSKNLAKLAFADRVHAPRRLAHPFQDYVKFLRDSQAQVERLYQLHKTGAFNNEGTPEGLEFVRERLAAGSQMLLNLWYTAWEESAVVPPEPKY